MKRLIGGLIFLNITALSLTLSASAVTITDAGILAQLGELRNFIDEKRDYTKESKGLKPVLLQYRSSGEKIDGIVNCNLSFNTDALHLSIAGSSIQAGGNPITIIINVVYEWDEYTGYVVDSATITATNQLLVEGDVEFGSDLEIDGDLQVNGSINDSNGNEAIDVGTSDVSISKNVNIGDSENHKDLYVSGAINGVENPSVKPIYWHSCTFKRITSSETDTLIFYYDFIILNNDPTPLTLDAFMSWLGENQSAEIKIVQGYDQANPSGLVSYFKYASPTSIKTAVVNVSTGQISEFNRSATADVGAIFTDVVNKIN